MLVYRLYKSTYIAQPLSAEGARRAGGRWHPYPILYTSATPELTLLEIVAHLNPLYLPNFHLLVLDISNTHHLVSLADLAHWQDEQQIKVSQAYLWNWLEAPDRLSVSVLSAIVDRSRNYLLHTLHPSFEDAVKIVENVPFRKPFYETYTSAGDFIDIDRTTVAREFRSQLTADRFCWSHQIG